MLLLFWLSIFLVFFAYIGYPLSLFTAGAFVNREIKFREEVFPTLSIILPVYNGERILAAKIENLLDLDYPHDKLEFIIVSDASTDNTAEIVQSYLDARLRFFELPKRTGKAGALNLAVGKANHELLVFTDAAILLEKQALKEIVKPFSDDTVGCVSGEDHIPGQSSEGLYGRYELMIRNLESRLSSIVGASGCFYAQRKDICREFPEGMAPDFYSVLKTVEKGYRAVTWPQARGRMGHSHNASLEFNRKVRTLVRGITALAHMRHLLHVFKYGFFSFELWCHKVLRWCAGLFLIAAFLSNLILIGNLFFLMVMIIQVLFYLAAYIGWKAPIVSECPAIFRIPFFFCSVNLASNLAIFRYVRGVRIEIWEPTLR